MADLDWLLYNAPTEYASLVLSGEIVNYLKSPPSWHEGLNSCWCIASHDTPAFLPTTTREEKEQL